MQHFRFFLVNVLLCLLFSQHISCQTNVELNRPLKVLHISFHQGCINDYKEVAQELSLDLTSWYVLSAELPRIHFDGVSKGNDVYNVTHERAKRVWDKHKDYFEQFDVIVTSDTAPLSRIFLQNGWQKPLIIWVCNRFDYCHSGGLGSEYYSLIKKASEQKNVKIISYTPYEHHYAAAKGINFGTRTIKPLGCLAKELTTDFCSSIPPEINKTETAFIYPRLDRAKVSYIKNKCAEVGIQTYSGRYNGPGDLKGFKGIIYFPYQWSNLALFENLQQGFIHFVPSEKFILENRSVPIRYCTLSNFHLCEWYSNEHRDLFVYFDSWADLKYKMDTLDYTALSEKTKRFAQQHRMTMIKRWQEVFYECEEYLKNN